MASPRPPTAPPGIGSEVQALANDVARDALAAARIGLRLAERIGRRGLGWVERTADRVLKDRK
ncbi:MAG: hypothetical protein L3J97_05165 [Thermoplasmata archaeon]|nr:hypothetical protein [Thermoplasmata archaeon]